MPDIVRVTNYVDGDILDADDLNNEFNNIIEGLNNLDDANISSTAAIGAQKISASIAGSGLIKNPSTGAIDVVPDDVTTEVVGNAIQIKDGGISAAKLATDSVTTAKIVNGNVTKVKLAALGQQQSGFATDSETSGTFADLAGLSISITTTGRPLLIVLKGLSTNSSYVRAEAPNGTQSDVTLAFVRGSTIISQYDFGISFTDSGASNIQADVLMIPSSAFWTIDTPAAGTYTYKVQGKNNVGTASSEIQVGAELCVFELG